MSKRDANRAVRCVKSNLLTLLTVAGVVCGIALGFIFRAASSEWTRREIMYIKFIGDIFLRMLKSLILPLIISSLICAIGSLDLKLSGKIGIRAIVYYLSTTVCAVILGIILVSTIRPGDIKEGSAENPLAGSGGRNVTTADTLMDLIRNCFPPNLVEATVKQFQTEIIYDPDEPDAIKEDWKIQGKFVDGTNILGLVVFSTVLGVTLSKMQEQGKVLLGFFANLSEAMMTITHWVVWLSPVGICFLIAGQLLEEKNIGDVFRKLGMYFVTVLIGLIIHGFFVLPLIYGVITRTMPIKFIGNMGMAMATAFGTASSSATLPITIKCLEEKNKVDPRVARFVLPIGATINMDGTALYEAVAAIFIAQMHGLSLDFGSILAISITSTAASIGAAGIPQAGLVTMVMVLNTIGLPAEYVSYILPVDWLLDRFRTAVNVLGDSIGAGLVDKLSAKELAELEPPPALGDDDDDDDSIKRVSQELEFGAGGLFGIHNNRNRLDSTLAADGSVPVQLDLAGHYDIGGIAIEPTTQNQNLNQNSNQANTKY